MPRLRVPPLAQRRDPELLRIVTPVEPPHGQVDHVVPGGQRGHQRLELRRLAEAGSLLPLVDATYPLDRIADAHRHVDRGPKRGNVVVTM